MQSETHQFYSRVEMTVATKRRFIAEVKRRDVLWNKDHDLYSRRKEGSEQWNEIATLFGMTKDIAKKVWKNLVDQYRKILYDLLRDHPNATPEETEELVKRVKWPYFKQLMFLSPIIAKSRVNGNIFSNFEDSSSSFDASLDEPFNPDVQLVVYPKKNVESDETSKQEGGVMPVVTIGDEKNESDDKATKGLSKDSSQKFGEYIVDLMRDVPSHLQRRCQQSLIQVINMYIEGNEPQMIFPTQTFSSLQQIS